MTATNEKKAQGSARFTPGPWEAVLIHEGVLGQSVGDMRGRFMVVRPTRENRPDDRIAMVEGGFPITTKGGFLTQRNENADAHLIAAAPDLYEALRGFSVTGPDADGLLWLRFKVGGKEAAISCRADGIVGSVVDEFQVECVAALAKAEGR